MSEINRLIAEKVFKWQMIDRLHYKDEHGNWVMDGIEFDPEHNISHAHMALKKFKVWKLWTHDDLFQCEITLKERYARGYPAATPAAAICEAIKSALEGKE